MTFKVLNRVFINYERSSWTERSMKRKTWHKHIHIIVFEYQNVHNYRNFKYQNSSYGMVLVIQKLLILVACLLISTYTVTIKKTAYLCN